MEGRLENWKGVEKKLGLEHLLNPTEHTIQEDKYYHFTGYGRKRESKEYERSIYGLRSKTKGKYDGVQEVASVNGVIWRLDILCMDIFLNVGYNQYKEYHSKDLQALLGDQYKEILEHQKKNRLFDIAEAKGTKFSNTEQHYRLKLIKRKGEFEKVEIRPKRARNAFHSFIEGKHYNYSPLIAKARQKMRENIEASQLVLPDNAPQHLKDEALKYNLLVSYGYARTTVCAYGHRIYSPVTQMSRELRQYLKPKHELEGKLIEIDRNASLLRILISLIYNSGEVYKILPEEAAREVERLIEENVGPKVATEFLDLLNEAAQGDMYSLFWQVALDKLLPNWQTEIEKSLSKEENQKYKKATDKKRFLVKHSFVVILNANPFKIHWVKRFTMAMKEDSLFAPLGELFYHLKSNSIRFNILFTGARLNALKGMKNRYHHSKNLGMICMQLESYEMQEMYLTANIWCTLVHDALQWLS